MWRRRSPLGHTGQTGRAPLRMLDGQRYGDRRKQHAYTRNLNRQKFACPHRSLTSGSLSHRNPLSLSETIRIKHGCDGPVRSNKPAKSSSKLHAFLWRVKSLVKDQNGALAAQFIIRDGYGVPDTDYLEPTNSKAVGGYAANGFALSPIRAVFSDSIGRVVVTSSEAVRLSPPLSTSCRRGGRQSDRLTIAPASRLSSGFSLLATSPRL
jgi:hypothetical protein